MTGVLSVLKVGVVCTTYSRYIPPFLDRLRLATHHCTAAVYASKTEPRTISRIHMTLPYVGIIVVDLSGFSIQSSRYRCPLVTPTGSYASDDAAYVSRKHSLRRSAPDMLCIDLYLPRLKHCANQRIS